MPYCRMPIDGLIHSTTCLPRPPNFIESSGVGQETVTDGVVRRRVGRIPLGWTDGRVDGWMSVSSGNNKCSHPLFTERSRPLHIRRISRSRRTITHGQDRKMQNTPKDGHVFVGRHDTFLICRCRCSSQNSMGEHGWRREGGGAVLFCLEAKRRRRRRRRRR